MKDPELVPDQPPPSGNGREVWPFVIGYATACDASRTLRAAMAERDTVGRARYGVPLSVDNGRDARVDAAQEALDLSVYLGQHLMELEAAPRPTGVGVLAHEQRIQEVKTDLRAVIRIAGHLVKP